MTDTSNFSTDRRIQNSAAMSSFSSSVSAIMSVPFDLHSQVRYTDHICPEHGMWIRKSHSLSLLRLPYYTVSADSLVVASVIVEILCRNLHVSHESFQPTRVGFVDTVVELYPGVCNFPEVLERNRSLASITICVSHAKLVVIK